VPLFSALVLVQTLTTGHAFQIDERLPAVAVAVVAVRYRAPFLVVVLLAAVTSATLHTLS
jgi:hypothetical protein